METFEPGVGGNPPSANRAAVAPERAPQVQLSEDHWKTLIRRIRAGDCTPVIGAGACWPVLRTGAQLSRTLAGRHGFPFTDSHDLARVTQFIAVKHRDHNVPKEEIREIIQADLARPRPETPLVHHALARIGSPIYLTTNYDDLMYDALQARKELSPHREVCRWNGLLLEEASAFDTGFQPTPRQPVVFHLHGTLLSTPSIVATEDDYLDFLVNISKDLSSSPVTLESQRRAMLPLPIRRALTRTTLLFIGYSLSDINFRVILRTLVSSLNQANRTLSVTLQLPPTADEHENVEAVRHYLERYFAWTLDLQVCWGNAEDFAAELEHRLSQAVAP